MPVNQYQFTNNLLSLSNNLQFYALSLTSSSDRADDLLQDTMLKALMYRDQFREDTNFKAWVYTIMKNTYINDYRKKLKKRNIFEESDNDFHLLISQDNVYPSPDSSFISYEIRQVINALKDDFRIPFNFFLDGYKYKEIAERMALPLGTVKSRIFFTRKKLEKSLREYSMS